MTPEQLFGILPPELAKIILDPKRTGVKVAQDPFKAYEDRDKLIDSQIEGVRGKYEELRLVAIKELTEKKLTVADLKKIVKEKLGAGYATGYNKQSYIKLIAEEEANEKSGMKRLIAKSIINRTTEQRRAAKEKSDTVDKEIADSKKKKQPKPSPEEEREFESELRRISNTLKSMRGSAYDTIRNDIKKRLAHKYRNIIAYREQN